MRLLLLLVLTLGGCSFPFEPRARYRWDGGWIQDSSGQYAMGEWEMIFDDGSLGVR